MVDPTNGLAGEQLATLYEHMLIIRETEERLADAVAAGEIRCPVHLYSGQEAVAVGVCANLKTEDYVFGTHRSHGHYLAKGGDLNAMIAEIYGRASGCARGRGGSMHVIDPANHIYANPIVASTISNAVGAGLALSRRRTNHVAVAFFGDGAVEEGRFSESLGLASLLKLPVVFVCENNLYASHVRIDDRQTNTRIFERAASFAMPGDRVDGNDVLAVCATAARAVERARQGGGPSLMECMTYRWHGHVGPNYDVDKGIRTPEELAEWQACCPIRHLGNWMRERGLASSVDLDAMHTAARSAVERAWEFARTSAFPEASELLDYVHPDGRQANNA